MTESNSFKLRAGRMNLLVAMALTSLLANNAANAETVKAPDWNAETLSGDWGGQRTALSAKGVNLDFVHKSDVMSNLAGGIKRGTSWLGHTEAKARIDLDKLQGWDGMSAYVHYHSDLGSKFNTHYVGSTMGVDNIEVATNTAQFFSAWLQKSMLDDRFSILGGLYAMDSEFNVVNASGVFLHPSF
ncbi:MAG TPA: carbohydrate porin, partial [Gallionella sp.]|nr:carbohydrate porin [Gallionella sp.]